MDSKDYSVRIGQEEIGHILNLKENLDHHGQLWTYLSRYRALDWDLAVLTSQGADLDLNLEQPQELCWKELAELGLDGVQLNLGIRTGRASRLLVLEVEKGGGASPLERLGDWRARSVAILGNYREQHYYHLPLDTEAPPSCLSPGVSIFGEGGLVLAPPSVEPEVREAWRWLTPPWETPPQPPTPAVWQFLRKQISPAPPGAGEISPWDEIYRVIARAESEPDSDKVKKLVSQHFFKLLAALGEKVMAESRSVDPLPPGLEAQATELEEMVAEIEQCLTSPAGGTVNPKTAFRPSGDRTLASLPCAAAMAPSRPKPWELLEVKAMVRDFLGRNPDLAGEQSRVQMVLFALRYYVSINPDSIGLSFQDKLEKAGQMARSFLDEAAEPH